MNAVLKIDPVAVIPPKYDNTRTASFGQWSRDNAVALTDYYLALGRSLPDEDDNNLSGLAKAQRFICFQKVQWDRARGVFV